MTRGDTERAAVRVAPDVREGLEAVRLSGLTNMLDRPAVAQIAAAMGYDDCARWVQENRDLYAHGVFQGFQGVHSRKGTNKRVILRGPRAAVNH